MNLYKTIINDHPNRNARFIDCLTSLLVNPSFNALFYFRVGQSFYRSKYRLCKFIASRIRLFLIFKRNCDISYEAVIGPRLKLVHPVGVVIGACEIGENVTIFQNVTLGSHGKPNIPKSYPRISDNVIIYSNATVLGGVKIGANSRIGASAVVNVDIPDNMLAVGIPCKIQRID